MFIVDQYPLAVFLCFITMLCWGSWANTQKLASATWRFELFYWDYVLGILLFSILCALTAGSMGNEGRSFFTDIRQADRNSIASAVTGGVIFNAANILLVAAIAIAGMSVAFPVGIGLALVIGVIVNYVTSPVGNVLLLFSGVTFVLAAIFLNAGAYRKLVHGSTGMSTKGLMLTIVSGSLMGLFYKYVAGSMFPDFSAPLDGKLSPYSAVFFFSVGILGSNVLFNSLLMRFPFSGKAVSYADYFRGSARSHLMGLVGGAIWSLGMTLSILASGAAGPAISYGLGQGATLVAALWGLLVWKEFRGASPSTQRMLLAMLVSFSVGLTLIIIAR